MIEAIVAAVKELLDEYAMGNPTNQALHGWRCQHPDRYGPCDCYERLIIEIRQTVEGVLREQER